jgi:hypothetical protein
LEENKLIISRNALFDLKELFIPEDASLDSYLCMSIIVEDSKINISEFAAYLRLIDNTYGRLTKLGIHSYSLRPTDQLKIGFESGSLFINIIESLANAHEVQILLVVLLLLRYLTGGLFELSAAYKNYEEGRLLRERRKMLRRHMRNESNLRNLSDTRKNQLVILIDELLLRGRRFLPKALRFAGKYVRHIKIEVISNSDKKNKEKKKHNKTNDK